MAEDTGGYQIDAVVLETAKVALAVNITKEVVRHSMSKQVNMGLLTV
ncbi:MAG: hypothetical protein U9R22_06955 [Pseudomonadota bacterium]|nr:hypothetical protein [Pseudomonadota bacterium]